MTFAILLRVWLQIMLAIIAVVSFGACAFLIIQDRLRHGWMRCPWGCRHGWVRVRPPERPVKQKAER